MMLPERPIVVPPTEGPPAPRPHGADTGQVVFGMRASAAAADGSDHTDYDRNPLKVAGLDHYLDLPGGVERFRIGG